MERWEKAEHAGRSCWRARSAVDRGAPGALQDYQIQMPEIVDRQPAEPDLSFLPGRLVVITEGEVFPQKQRKVRQKRPEDRKRGTDQKLSGAESRRLCRAYQPRDREISSASARWKSTASTRIICTSSMPAAIGSPCRSTRSTSCRNMSAPRTRSRSCTSWAAAEWQRAKSRARKSVQDIADDLIKLYAERQATPGYAFSQGYALPERV